MADFRDVPLCPYFILYFYVMPELRFARLKIFEGGHFGVQDLFGLPCQFALPVTLLFVPLLLHLFAKN